MFTYLPYTDFERSARCLTDPILKQQQIDCLDVIEYVFIPVEYKDVGSPLERCRIKVEGRWKNHPVSKMWAHYRWALLCYSFAINRECILRGFDNIESKLKMYGNQVHQKTMTRKFPNQVPKFIYDMKLKLSHRAALIREDPEHYKTIFKVKEDTSLYFPGD